MYPSFLTYTGKNYFLKGSHYRQETVISWDSFLPPFIN